MPSSVDTGPLMRMRGAAPAVVAATPPTLYSAVRAARTEASTTGMWTGVAPAITALAATFSTVTVPSPGGMMPRTSSGGRLTALTMTATRSSVGGITGRPSLQPRSKKRRFTSSNDASTCRRLALMLALLVMTCLSSSQPRYRAGRSRRPPGVGSLTCWPWDGTRVSGGEGAWPWLGCVVWPLLRMRW